jgi:tRNA dimethylallyltransferase
MDTPILIVCGPTASGKSALALDLAQKCGGVIINADSQQVYRELPILTARPTPEEETRAPHRLYGFLPLTQRCSAGEWLRHARIEIDWARGEGRTPIVTGGTGLYLKALMEGMAEIPAIDPAVSAQAQADYEAMGAPAFRERLSAVDAGLTFTDPQRMVRAYAVWLGTGKPLSWWQAQGNKPMYDRSLFRISKVIPERPELYRRCDARFARMLEMGALEEVAGCRVQGAGTVIGYTELSAHLRGECTLLEAAARAQQATRNYAKRQLTWFRNQMADA